MGELKNKAAKGIFWSSVDRFSSQGLQFVFGILIARLLLPSDYGVVAMLGIFMAISQTFIDSGFGAALIRKTDRTEVDFSTVFYFNVAVALLAYGLLWLASPYIAAFYNIPMLDAVTKVVALHLVINALSGIHGTKLSIAINFKTLAKISLTVTLLTGVVGLWMAYNGYGVWALVVQALFGSALRCALLWLFVRWMPGWVFSWRSFRELFAFGSKMLASALLDTTYNNIYTIVIGKRFSSTSLGVYSRADSLAQYPSSNITGVLQNVTFPVLSSIQDDTERLGNAYKRFLRMSAFVVFPLMIGLAAVADPLIRLVLTDKWAGSIYLLQIICFDMMWYPIHAINLNLLQVKGRSDYFLKLEIIKKTLGVVTLCATIPLGLVAMCYGRVFISVVCLGLNTYYTKKLVDYGFVKQMRELTHIFVHAMVMGVLVWLLVQSPLSQGLKLLTGVVAGGLYYIIGAYLMKFEELKEILSLKNNSNGKSTENI